MTPPLGAHMSAAGGVSKAFERGQAAGCDTIQIFTRNQNRWDSKPLDPGEVANWRAAAAATGIAPAISHGSYLINLGSPDETLWRRSVEALVDELRRAETLGLLGVVLHPGAHMEQGEEAGIARVAAGLDLAHAATAGFKTLTLLEITAGQGTTLGCRFEHLAAMRAQAADPERLAVCFDTCHAFAAGYDFREPAGYAAMLDAFDQTVGLAQLRCFHLNDSKGGLGSRKDRHEHIGQGAIGLNGFSHILNDPRFANTPMILETPKGDDMGEDVANLAVLRGLLIVSES